MLVKNKHDEFAHPGSRFSVELETNRLGSAVWIWERDQHDAIAGCLASRATWRRWDPFLTKADEVFLKAAKESGIIEPFLDYLVEQYPDMEPAVVRLLEVPPC